MTLSQSTREIVAEYPDDLAVTQDEAEFLIRLRNRDAHGFEEIVHKYGGRMLATAKRFLRSEHDSADAVQDAFVSAFRSLASFEGNSCIGTWLHRIVINACLMKLRKGSRDRSVSIESLLPQFDNTGHRIEVSPRSSECAPANLEREELRAKVRECIDLLPERYRHILILRDIEEIDTDETALILGIRIGAVKTRLHRARQALKSLLESQCISS